jgi:hypothetical protein
MKHIFSLLAVVVTAANSFAQVGGANSPKPFPPQKLILDTAELTLLPASG